MIHPVRTKMQQYLPPVPLRKSFSKQEPSIVFWAKPAIYGSPSNFGSSLNVSKSVFATEPFGRDFDGLDHIAQLQLHVNPQTLVDLQHEPLPDRPHETFT